MFMQTTRRLARAATMALALILGLAATASAAPALWKIQGPGATIYLFGTIHVLKPGVSWRSPAIDAALTRSDALWLETPNADDPAALQPLIAAFGLDPAHPLSSKIGPDDEARLSAVLAPLGTPAARLEPLRPWMAGLAVSTLPLAKAGYDPDKGVEHLLKVQMSASGKTVSGFETAEEQIRYLADLPPDAELSFFRSSLSEAARAVATADDLAAAWVQGDESRIETLLNRELQAKYPDLYQRLIVSRNVRFAEQIAGLAKGHGVIFVAIGAGHLVGPDSVQADLARYGLVAERQ